MSTKGNQVFTNMAKLVSEKRKSHSQGYSQSELSHQLGYKNGQFISNVERGKCSLPNKVVPKFCELLNVDREDVVTAKLADEKATMEATFKAYDAAKETEGTTTETATSEATTAPEASVSTPSEGGFGQGLA